MGKFQFSLWHLFYATWAVAAICFAWTALVKPAIDSGAFEHQKTYREVQIERGRQALERAKNAQLIP